MSGKTMTAVRGTLLGLLIMTMTAGCFTMERPFPAKQYYMLDVVRPASPPSAAGRVVEIGSVSVAAQYEGKAFVHYHGDGVYASDFYNGFFVSPNAMFTEILRRWATGSGLFRHVVDFSSYVEASHILEGKVVCLYADYSSKSDSSAVLGMEVVLVETGTDSPRNVIFSKLYRFEIPLKGTGPRALVEGWNTALEQLLTALGDDLKEVLRESHSGATPGGPDDSAAE